MNFLYVARYVPLSAYITASQYGKPDAATSCSRLSMSRALSNSGSAS
jgi:hypothetical protein